jgi:hypothetical protein
MDGSFFLNPEIKCELEKSKKNELLKMSATINYARKSMQRIESMVSLLLRLSHRPIVSVLFSVSPHLKHLKN